MKRSGFKRKIWGLSSNTKTEKLTPKNLSIVITSLKRQKKLRVVGHSTTVELKEEIQSVLRQIVIKRDGGCILRHYENEIITSYRYCGGFRKDGELILQAEHLHSRSNAISFSDSRLVVCLCHRHHFHYKKQYPQEYYKIVREHIGKERSNLLDRVMEDHHPHKADLKMELIALRQEFKKLLTV